MADAPTSAAAAADISKTHPYTCNSCAVAFRNSDAQRAHMRTDWHRYNLKRKVAELPPVSSDDYNEKVLAAQATTKAAQAQAAFIRACEVCQKTYYSGNAYQNHISSQKHKLRAASVGQRSGSVTTTATTTVNTPGESADDVNGERDTTEAAAEFEQVVAGMKKASLEKDPLSRRPSAPRPDATSGPEHPLSPTKPNPAAVPLSRCLFCNYDSPNMKTSIDHMARIHGMFIPEQQYLVDLEGLIAYFQAKIRENHECLSCHRLKNTTDGIQTHMRDKAHCKIAFESEEEMIEVGQFYDFSSTYSDDEEETDEDDDNDEDNEAQMKGVRRSRGGVKIDGEEEDDGWETDSSYSSVDSQEIGSLPIDDRSQSYSRLSKNKQHNNAVFYDDHEMHLPSGRVAGHRSLKKYFRQNLHSYPTPAERMERAQRLLDAAPAGDSDEDSDEVMEDATADGTNPRSPTSKALLRRGEAGMLGATSTQRREVRLQEQRGRTTAQRQQNRYQAKLEKQANSQKHFRDPLLQ